MQDHFTIRVGFEFRIWRERLLESTIVINFAIDTEDLFFILAYERLRTGVYDMKKSANREDIEKCFAGLQRIAAITESSKRFKIKEGLGEGLGNRLKFFAYRHQRLQDVHEQEYIPCPHSSPTSQDLGV